MQPKQNITRLEKTALDNLSKNTEIIIKSADKGGGVVIMDKAYCFEETHNILSDFVRSKILQIIR